MISSAEVKLPLTAIYKGLTRPLPPLNWAAVLAPLLRQPFCKFFPIYNCKSKHWKKNILMFSMLCFCVLSYLPNANFVKITDFHQQMSKVQLLNVKTLNLCKSRCTVCINNPWKFKSTHHLSLLLCITWRSHLFADVIKRNF